MSESVKFYSKSAEQYENFQQGVIPAVAGTLKLCSVDSSSGMTVAIRFITDKGPVCYLVDSKEFSEAVKGCLGELHVHSSDDLTQKRGTVPDKVVEEKSFEEKTSETIRGNMTRLEDARHGRKPESKP